MICVLQNIQVTTFRGKVALGDLRVGDKVRLANDEFADVIGLRQRVLSARELSMDTHLKPIMIRKGALGHDLPTADTMVAPNQRVLVAREFAMTEQADEFVLIAAKQLVNNKTIYEVDMMAANYVHVIFDRHEMVEANGLWIDSFQATDWSKGIVGNAQRTEILELFPDLRKAVLKALEIEPADQVPEAPKKKRFLFF